jgi:hypothetical protein
MTHPGPGTFYFFDIVSTGHAVRDEEGAAFDDLDAARAEAVLMIREMVGEELRHGAGLDDARWVEPRNEQGTMLGVIPFKDALKEG